MKWTKPSHGDTRAKVKFLWLPKRIGKVTRWLEFAEWEDRYEGGYGYDDKWKSKKWIIAPENDNEQIDKKYNRSICRCHLSCCYGNMVETNMTSKQAAIIEHMKKGNVLLVNNLDLCRWQHEGGPTLSNHIIGPLDQMGYIRKEGGEVKITTSGELAYREKKN